MFNWSVIDRQQPIEKFAVSMKFNEYDLHNNMISTEQLLTQMVNQFNVQFQNRISEKLYSTAIMNGCVYALKDGVITFSEIDVIRAIDIRLLDEALNCDFIIANPKLVTYIYDSIYFSPKPPNDYGNNNIGIIDVVGSWHGLPVYLDPHLKFSDNTIYFGNKNLIEIGITDTQFTHELATIIGGYNITIHNNLKSMSIVTNDEEYQRSKAILREIALTKMGI